jgi:hypothetical protein
MSVNRKKFQSGHDNVSSLMADIFLLFSRSAPFMIVSLLRRKRMTLKEISKSLGITQKAALQALTILQAKGVLLFSSKAGNTSYRLADKGILSSLDLITKISKRKARQIPITNPINKAPNHSGHSQA